MRRNNPIVLVILIFMNVLPGLMLIAFLILGLVLHENLFFFLIIVPVIFLAVLNGIYFGVGKSMFEISYEYYEDRLREDTSNDDQSPFLEDPFTDVLDVKELDSDVLSDESNDWDIPIILVDVFTGNITNQKCAICKLSFDKKETILQCKNCLALFHKEHLKQWLVTHSSCPVCETELKIK